MYHKIHRFTKRTDPDVLRSAVVKQGTWTGKHLSSGKL
jgi:hypothetical protein